MAAKIKAKFNSFCKKDNNHKWNEGDEIFWDGDKKIVCNNEECYLSQGGAKLEEKKFFSKKSRTTEERVTDCTAFINLCNAQKIPISSEALAEVFSF